MVEMKDGLEIERERELKLQREEHSFLETRNKEQNQQAGIALLRLKRKADTIIKQRDRLNSIIKR